MRSLKNQAPRFVILPSMSYQPKVLAVDDDDFILESIRLILEEDNIHVDTFTDPSRIVSAIQMNHYDLVLLDMNYQSGVNNGNEGIFWLNTIRKYKPQLPVLFITAFGEMELAIKSFRLGAADFIQKPFDHTTLLDRCKAILVQQPKKQSTIDIQQSKEEYIWGESQAVQNIKSTVEKVADSISNVLLCGEEGCGKDSLAQEIHQQSSRRNKKLVKLNLAEIPDTLIEGELFGYIKGAFTDAKKNYVGRVMEAQASTLYIDNINHLSLDKQSKLLTILQTKEIRPIGSNQAKKCDFRLITSSSQDLVKLVKEGLFRQDLFYRINTIHINIPSLHQRRIDIPALTSYFLTHFNAVYGKEIQFTEGAIQQLQQKKWSGNLHELKHIIEKTVILSDTNVVETMEINQDIEEENIITLSQIEKKAILKSLRNHQGNIKNCAEELGITRQTLYNKLKKYDIQ